MEKNQVDNISRKIGYWEEHGTFGTLSLCFLASVGKGHYVNGRKEGEWKFYTDDNFLSFVVIFKNGLLNGPTIIHNLNNSVKEIILFIK